MVLYDSFIQLLSAYVFSTGQTKVDLWWRVLTVFSSPHLRASSPRHAPGQQIRKLLRRLWGDIPCIYFKPWKGRWSGIFRLKMEILDLLRSYQIPHPEVVETFPKIWLRYLSSFRRVGESKPAETQKLQQWALPVEQHPNHQPFLRNALLAHEKWDEVPRERRKTIGIFNEFRSLPVHNFTSVHLNCAHVL